jgi:hypothetical protein
MKKLIVLTASTVGVIAVLMAMFGSGVAAADAYAGQTYADATSALSAASLKGVIAGRVGTRVATDQCVVTRSEKAHWNKGTTKGTNFAPVKDTVLLFLNCNATVASANTPGNSAASPEGRAALVAATSAPSPPKQK